MPLTSPRAMFERAYKEGYAIGAFNVNNMEIIQGIMEAGTEEKAPLILQVSAGARKYAGQNYIVKLIEAGLLEADLPVVLHLDHGADFDICKACVDGGFTSVMIDGSHHSFEDNIAVTKRVVEYAHAHGVWVALPGLRKTSLPSTASIPIPIRPWSSWSVPAATRSPSPSAPATARTNSRVKPSSTSNASKRSAA